ncbi:MAG: pirin family protein [Deltaproteobacteria bacterium]
MLTIRPAASRGRTAIDWLDSWHTFSFGDYRDPKWRGFRSLRVINDDRIAPLGGFDTHPHRDMEIITWVLSGALEHRDSLGNGSVIRPGDMQRMTAGTGILHSEFNPSPNEPVHLLQIWLFPDRKGLAPGYEQRAFAQAELHNALRLVGSQDGRYGSVTIHQDADVYSATLEAGRSVRHEVSAGRHAWVQVARGSVDLNGRELATGDGVAVTDERSLEIAGRDASEIVLFDLA